MFDHLQGEVAELTPTTAVVSVNGVGYVLSIPMSTYEALRGTSSALVYAHLHVREDDLRLFGFATKEERRLFRMLISVSGVGPAMALACLTSLSPRDLLVALAAGDVKTLQRVKGVGRKVAERLVVDLKDRSSALAESLRLPLEGQEASGVSARASGEEAAAREDAVRALVEIGYAARPAADLVSRICADLVVRGEPVDLESVIKLALRR